MKSLKFFCLLIVMTAAALVGRHYKRPIPIYSESRMMMDTIITINVYGAENAKSAADAGFAEFQRVEAYSSFHEPGSELSSLNQNGRLADTASLTSLLEKSRKFCRQTDGYFDPSFALLQKAYGFYEGRGRLLSNDEICALMPDCGLLNVLELPETGSSGGEAVLASGALLDLGGIAGGFAIEKAADAIRAAGCKCFLIDDAGDIWFEGTKPDGSSWRIAVRDPRDGSVLAYFESKGSGAVSTSGDYERFIEVNGKRYGHIMNPHTGCPADYYSSVTVSAETPMEADVLSTAIFAMPRDKAMKYIDSHEIAAVILTKQGEVIVSRRGQACFKDVKNK